MSDSTLWTGERCRQLRKLELLVEAVSMADRGSSFIRRFQDAEKLAAELSDSKFPDRSFIQFLNDVAIESRRHYLDNTGRIPD